MPRIFSTTLADNHRHTWKVLIAALEVCLSRKLIDRLSLADVAGEAGMARNTIYNYVPDKVALLAAAADHCAATLVADLRAVVASGEPASSRIARMLELILAAVVRGDHPAIMGAAVTLIGLDPDDPPSFLIEIRMLFQTVHCEGADAGVLRPFDALTWSILAGTIHAAVLQIKRSSHSCDRIITETTRIVFAALTVPEPT
ncbi:TetR/AcrR family transcriptional regulator [Asaia sp. BMEF1]|uniref:TetR/AcrR family transcriptional regulator n=1 Tax=Asaia sp. BMEF1 TaxID=3155932 RepID=UPI003F6744F2